MKALVIRQPWASLIMSGKKSIELRTWRSHFRGQFVVCASAGAPKKANAGRFPGLDMPRGVAVAVVELVNVREATAEDAPRACCDVEVGREFAWELRVVRVLKPFPVKGRLSFFDVSDEEIARAS